MVDNWSGTIAQLNCNVMLQDVASVPNIPTLADVNAVYGNATSVAIITSHLNSVLNYAGVSLQPAQLAETALSILASYWYLNLAELCLFFCQLKNGSRGQFVWGAKINNQAIMVALADFCRERRDVITKKQIEATKAEIESSFSRVEDAAAAMFAGITKWQEALIKARKNLKDFRTLFPKLPQEHPDTVWFEAWRGELSALQQIYGEKIPPVKIAVDDIGKHLCDYNIRHKQ